jgi:hypothetical protein
MRKPLCVLFIVFAGMAFAKAQVFNAGTGLRGNAVSLGFAPTLYNSNFMLWMHGDIKLKPGADLIARIGFGGENYFGGGFKFGLLKRLAISAGAHYYGDVGLDGTMILNIPIKGDAAIISGLDLDILFPDDIEIPVWLPVGLDVKLSTAISVMLEGDIGLTDNAGDIFGGGLIVFF